MKPTQEQLNDPLWWDEHSHDQDFIFFNSSIGGYQFANKYGLQYHGGGLLIGEESWALLAKRPTKPAFVPEVGVECEYSVLKGVYKTGEVLKVTKPDSFNVYAIMDSKTNQLHWATDIRPIKSERELFLKAARKVTGADIYESVSTDLFNDLYDSGLFKLVEQG